MAFAIGQEELPLRTVRIWGYRRMAVVHHSADTNCLALLRLVRPDLALFGAVVHTPMRAKKLF